MSTANSARIMPHNIDAEQAVLGAVLIDEIVPVNVIPVLREDDFYSGSHRTIFRAMSAIYSRNIPIDFITLNDELESSGNMTAAGGITYITTLTTIVPSAANHMHYVDIVKKCAVMRRLIEAGSGIVEAAYRSNDNALAMAEKAVYDVARNEDRSSLQDLKAPLTNIIDKFETISMDRDAFKGLPTGFAELDKILHGLQPSDLIIIAARPGMGKTSFAMNLVTNAALAERKGGGKYSCAVFSLEMSADQIAQRMLCSVAKISMKSALNGTLKSEEWSRLLNTRTLLADANIFIDDNTAITPGEILSKCRRLKRKSGLDLIMIDYLQLMNSGERRTEGRQQQVADFTRALKVAAKELNVPILLLSQMNRAAEKRQGADSLPMLSDLRESGAIEQDADIVMFLHRKHLPTETEIPERQRNTCSLIIAKHRNGELDTIPLYWYGDRTTFYPIDSPDAKQRENIAKRIFNRTEDGDEQGDYLAPDTSAEGYVPPEEAPPDDGEEED